MSEDGRYFVVNPALLEALTPSLKLDLSALAIRRMADHFGDDEFLVGAMVERALGR